MWQASTLSDYMGLSSGFPPRVTRSGTKKTHNVRNEREVLLKGRAVERLYERLDLLRHGLRLRLQQMQSGESSQEERNKTVTS